MSNYRDKQQNVKKKQNMSFLCSKAVILRASQLPENFSFSMGFFYYKYCKKSPSNYREKQQIVQKKRKKKTFPFYVPKRLILFYRRPAVEKFSPLTFFYSVSFLFKLHLSVLYEFFFNLN